MGWIKIIYLPNPLKKIDFLFLEHLHHFLKGHPKCILREIKAEFQNITKFDVKLDDFIENQWISRQNKRYETCLEEFSKSKSEIIISKASSFVNELQSMNLSLEEAFEGMTINTPVTPIVISDKNYEEVRKFLFSKNHLTSNKYSVTTYENEAPHTSLTNYFSGKFQTEELRTIYNILGDVTSDYYLDQTLGKLFRSKDKPLKEERKDIFTDSLYYFGLLDEEKKATVSFKENGLVDNSKIAKVYISFQNEVENWSYFYQEIFKGVTLSKLFNNGELNLANHSLTYIEKNKKGVEVMSHHCVSLVPLFNHLDEGDQEVINQLAHQEEFSKGETIVSPLDEGKLVIIAKGAVKLYQLNVNGKEQLLRVMEPGDFEGDQELFGTKNENTYGEALQKTTVCTVNKNDFQDLLLKHPEIALKLLQINAEKMLQVEKQAQFLATDSIDERLATYLLDLMKAKESTSIELPFKSKELAAFIGTTPETISRKMKDFEEKGWIKRDKKEIEILDVDSLEEI